MKGKLDGVLFFILRMDIEFHNADCAPGKTHDHVPHIRHTRTGCQVDCVLRLTFRRQCLNIP